MGRHITLQHSSTNWGTPPALYANLDREFHFDLDPCPLDGHSNGLGTLLCPWRGRRVFCNPPYGPRLGEWLARAEEAALAVYLLPVRTERRWFQDLVWQRATEIRFIRGRLKFGTATNDAPFASMVVIFQQGQPGLKIRRCDQAGKVY